MTNSTSLQDGWRDMRFTSNDGLSLYARHYQAADATGTPLLCLAGLSRNAADFHMLAVALSGDSQSSREVFCLDSRGRGRSEYDGNSANYTPYIEMLDALDFLTVAGLHRAVILGTSRGGMLAMMMGAVRPGNIAGVILNDIGPKIEVSGLARIKSYIGRTPNPRSWEEAVTIIKGLNEGQFSALSEEDWTNFARQIFAEDESGKPVSSYDAKLSTSLEGLDVSQELPTMWPQFQSLTRVPLMLIRGENSDILSKETAEEMSRRHNELDYLEIRGQGHAPLLWDPETHERIRIFLEKIDSPKDAILPASNDTAAA